MNYEITVSPELNLNMADLVANWNASAEAKALATAQVKEGEAVSFGDPITLTVVLMGVAAGAATVTTSVVINVLTNVLTKVVEQKLLPPEQTLTREFIKITPMTLPNGTTMLVIDRKQ